MKPCEGICALRPQRILGDRVALQVVGRITWSPSWSPKLECLSVYLADEGERFECRMTPDNEGRRLLLLCLPARVALGTKGGQEEHS